MSKINSLYEKAVIFTINISMICLAIKNLVVVVVCLIKLSRARSSIAANFVKLLTSIISINTYSSSLRIFSSSNWKSISPSRGNYFSVLVMVCLLFKDWHIFIHFLNFISSYLHYSSYMHFTTAARCLNSGT